MKELDFDGAMSVLVEDARHAIMRLLPGPEEQFARRSYVRASFAMIEAWTFAAKKAVLKAHENGVAVVSLSAGEVAGLTEESYSISEDGSVSIQRKYPAFMNNFRFTFAMFAKAFGKTYVLDVSGVGWQDFSAATKVRNRITHPRSAAALAITYDEARLVERAVEWFMRASSELVRGAGTWNPPGP
jgi:hypothetical protein